MSKQYKIAITNDTQRMRCRLLIKLIEICGATPVLINFHLGSKLHKGNVCDIDFSNIKSIALEKHLQNVESKLDSCDAMILPGNMYDISPSFYNVVDIHPETQRRIQKNKLNVRTETEIFMANYAIKKRQIPLLGICGGMQIVNVALGGSLTQNIPDFKSNIIHSDPLQKKLTKIKKINWEKKFNNHILAEIPKNIFSKTHSMKVLPNTHLASIYKTSDPNIDLNEIYELSIHHQGCFLNNLAKGLKVSAVASDGIIEAAELDDHIMCLLTQFHVECNVSNIAKITIDKLLDSLKF